MGWSAAGVVWTRRVSVFFSVRFWIVGFLELLGAAEKRQQARCGCAANSASTD